MSLQESILAAWAKRELLQQEAYANAVKAMGETSHLIIFWHTANANLGIGAI